MYFVDSRKMIAEGLPKEWEQNYEGTDEESAVHLAEVLLESGRYVDIYNGDTLYWRNGRYATPYDFPSPFEREFIKMGGEPGLPKVPLYEYKTDKSYLQELADEETIK